MAPAASVQTEEPEASVKTALARQQSLPLYTDMSTKWELDSFNPPLYKSVIFYAKQGPEYETEKPYFMNIPIDDMPGVQQTNVGYTRRVVAVADVRGHENLFTLDRNGFQLSQLNTGLAYEDFADSQKIISQYYKEVKLFLLSSIPGAVDVLPFDFQVRRKDPSLPRGSRGAPGKAQPFAAVHADQTTKAAVRRLYHFHPEKARQYGEGRFQIVNVWKPLRGPVRDSPLAVCDYRTVHEDDRVPCDIIFPDYLGETYNFWPSPRHRYYYLDEQQADEAWMIKCFDSATLKTPGIAQFAPHVSFQYFSKSDPSPLLRESVEVRTFVFLG